MRQAVIMAGGAGTRLWPLSLTARPKQLMHIVEGKSLLRLSFERLYDWLPASQIHVITSAAHLPQVQQELPEMPAANLIGEPCGRDTVNAIGLCAHLLGRSDPDGTMGIFTADHIIRPIPTFREAVEKAYETAEQFPDALVTFGIKPTHPHTGLGYVQRGKPIGPGVHEVVQFKEKPELAVAERYVASGEYLWNSGMFVWRSSAFLAELQRHVPDSHEKLGRIAAADGPERQKQLEALFPTLTKISVDFAIMEKARQVLVVEMPVQWLDVGSWTALTEVLAPDAEGNVRTGGAHRTLDARGNILVAEGEHLIATIGVSDLVVIAGPTATLVCHKNDVQRIKHLVETLQNEGLTKYL
ncbi:MAG: mannose-1-phosphate guanylyltransferase [Phycisphaerae bacterium]|nr:mannose-1-phosphate guanylyltransferase [Phycisphaerae bacterium]